VLNVVLKKEEYLITKCRYYCILKTKIKKIIEKENIELLCYNCFYLFIGDIFTNKQIEGLEDHKPVNLGKSEWDVDEYHLKRLKELGLDDGSDVDQYISRI
jgi:hypothetical protein